MDGEGTSHDSVTETQKHGHSAFSEGVSIPVIHSSTHQSRSSIAGLAGAGSVHRGFALESVAETQKHGHSAFSEGVGMAVDHTTKPNADRNKVIVKDLKACTKPQQCSAKVQGKTNDHRRRDHKPAEKKRRLDRRSSSTSEVSNLQEHRTSCPITTEVSTAGSSHHHTRGPGMATTGNAVCSSKEKHCSTVSCTASHGNTCTASHGNTCTASHGNTCTASHGNTCTASHGNTCTASHGNTCTASHGNTCTASHGNTCSASHGNTCTASHGNTCTASHGNTCTASHGNTCTASHGNTCTASHGNTCTASHGNTCTASHGNTCSASHGNTCTASHGNTCTASHDTVEQCFTTNSMAAVGCGVSYDEYKGRFTNFINTSLLPNAS